LSPAGPGDFGAAPDRNQGGAAGTDAGRPASGGGGGGGRGGAGGGLAVDARPARDAAADTVDGPQPEAPSDAGDGAVPHPRVLSLVLQGAPWYATQATQGIAVDANNRVYVGDNASIFAVDGSVVSTYLTTAEVAGPTALSSGFGDFDIAPDGQLYIVAAKLVQGSAESVEIITSNAAHQAQPWASLATVNQPQELGVISDGYVGLVSRDGFWTFNSNGGSIIYSTTKLGSPGYTCATEDLATAPSGVFLYLPGCNGSPLLRGRADGSGVSTLYETQIGQSLTSPVVAANFLCAARDPSGGFYFVVSDTSDTDPAPHLYHVTEDAQGTNGLELIDTIPTFAQAKQSQNEVYGFDFCSLAVARDSTVFFQTYHQLWKVSP
jgi:hypothetical protein